jgi:sulfotransferase family protein
VNFDSVLIITYGRSGSTLLQGLLNSIDGCVVRGENHNFCYGLYLAYQSIKKTRQDFGKNAGTLAPTSSWFGAALLDERRFLQDARSLVYHQLLGAGEDGAVKCCGFKEIRYLSKSLAHAQFHKFLDFLAELFPKPAFLFLTRDHGEVAQSGWWTKRDKQQVQQALRVFEASLAVYSKGRNFVFSIDYRDMTQRTQRLRGLFEFLGAPYIEERIERVLATQHSFKSKSMVSSPPPVCCTATTVPAALQHFSIDKRLRTSRHEGFTIQGIAMLKADVEGDYSLVAKDSVGEHAVVWGLPSPAVAKKYHGAPGASSSRFRINGLKLEGGAAAELYLVEGGIRRERLATISLQQG